MGGIETHTLRSTLSRPEDLTTIVEAPSHDHQLPLERKTPRFQPNTLICHWLLSPRNITAIPVVSPFVSPENRKISGRFVAVGVVTSPGGPVPKFELRLVELARLLLRDRCNWVPGRGRGRGLSVLTQRHWGHRPRVGFLTKKTGWKLGETSPTRYRKHWFRTRTKNFTIILRNHLLTWIWGDNGEARHCLAYFSFSSTIMVQWKMQCLQDRPLFLYNFESFSLGSSI